ncbi:MAG: hypothetical protein M1817_000252 [Caeruleum heppii]|nr:MAG: hypothetical protein M1817_000252 [Caeruleum heppii]
MASDGPPTTPSEAPITFTIKSSSDAKYTLTLPASTTILELKTKLAGEDYANLPADRQRLIYSGRVLKDPDTLGTHKIQDGHTVHLVRSASSNQRQNPANQGSSTAAGASTAAGPGQAAGPGGAAAGVPTNLAAGTGNNPLAGLTGARYAGLAQLPGAGMFGPDGGMGAPPNPEQMVQMLQNPQFASTINEALQNPQVLDMMIQQNPMLREMGPGARQMMQSPEFRRMMTDPEALRSMSEMSRAMGMGGPFGGMGGMGGAGGGGGFPAPGVTDTTPAQPGTTQTPGQEPSAGGAQQPPPNPFAALFGLPPTTNADGSQAQQPPPNPFAAMLNPAIFGQQLQNPSPATPNTDQTPTTQPPPNPLFANNPLLQNPQAMQQMLAAMTGGGAGAGGAGDNPGAFNPFAALAGLGGGNPTGETTSTPPDNRPPEERYADQLRQLNDMGFYEFERNVTALRRSGGSVQGAVEFLLSQ